MMLFQVRLAGTFDAGMRDVTVSCSANMFADSIPPTSKLEQVYYNLYIATT